MINQIKIQATTLIFIFFANSNLVASPAQNLAIEFHSATVINQLSKKLLTSKLEDTGLQNSMISAVSLYYALSILERGAAGETAEKMLAILTNDAGYAVQDSAPELSKILVSSKIDQRPEFAKFRLANAIWSTNGNTSAKPFVFSSSFRSDAMNYYDAMATSLDFMAPGVSKVMNNWVQEKTNGLITDIIDDQTMQAFVWLITNAAYFEGAWGTQMKRVAENATYYFKSIQGQDIQADTIKTQDYKARVLDQDDGSVAFRLPFYGNQFSFVIYLPPESETNIQEWLMHTGINRMPELIKLVSNNQSTVYQLAIQLPVFEFRDQLEMLEGSPLAATLGLASLFSDRADLSLMVDAEKTHPSLHATKVGLIKQDTKIVVDENGLKAAAVTLIGGVKVTSIAPALPCREIIVNRPFVFSIVENSSHTMLFNGVVVQPTP